MTVWMENHHHQMMTLQNTWNHHYHLSLSPSHTYTHTVMVSFKERKKVQTKSYYLFLTINTAHERMNERNERTYTIEQQNEIGRLFFLMILAIRIKCIDSVRTHFWSSSLSWMMIRNTCQSVLWWRTIFNIKCIVATPFKSAKKSRHLNLSECCITLQIGRIVNIPSHFESH